jgi:hypothetical protein
MEKLITLYTLLKKIESIDSHVISHVHSCRELKRRIKERIEGVLSKKATISDEDILSFNKQVREVVRVKPDTKDIIKEREELYKLKDELEIRDLPEIHLKQSNFEEGTYIISESGMYILDEDIVFEPNKDNNFMPRSEQTKYQGKGFTFGFFTIISVQTENVIIDLNNKTLRMSNLFRLIQRFCSCIELANTPFIENQGPGDFGPLNKIGKNVLIRNGTLGLVAHHGIRANNAENLFIENVHIKEQIGPSLKNIQVKGNFSAAMFIKRFFKNDEKLDLTKCQPLFDTIDDVINEIETSGETTNPLFHQVLPDGVIYGILTHETGVAVNDFAKTEKVENMCKTIVIEDTVIQDLACDIIETPGISTRLDGKGIQTDFSGSVFVLPSLLDEQERYKGNVLSETMIEIARKYQDIPTNKLSITKDVIDFVDGKITLSYLLEMGYKWKVNTDVMHHIPKGIFGIRSDATNYLMLSNVKLKNISNVSKLGNTTLVPNYVINHDKQVVKGYQGIHTTGINLNNVHNVLMTSVMMEDLNSDNGETRGYRIMNDSTNLNLDTIRMNNFTSGISGTTYSHLAPNYLPSIYGIKIECDCTTDNKHINNENYFISNYSMSNFNTEYAINYYNVV